MQEERPDETDENVLIGDQAWRSVPASIRGAVAAASLQTFIDEAVAALDDGDD